VHFVDLFCNNYITMHRVKNVDNTWDSYIINPNEIGLGRICK